MYILNCLYNSAYPSSYSSTSFIEFTTSQMSSLSNRNIDNTRSVTLALFSLVSFLNFYFILKSLIRGVLFPILI